MADAPDGFTESNWELGSCAQANFENVEKFFPELKTHPIYQIARMQFDALVKRLGDEVMSA